MLGCSSKDSYASTYDIKAAATGNQMVKILAAHRHRIRMIAEAAIANARKLRQEQRRQKSGRRSEERS